MQGRAINPFKFPFPVEFINAGFLSAVVLLESLQLVLAAMGAAEFFPVPNPLSDVVFGEWRWIIQPEREELFYRTFVVCAVILQCLSLKMFEKRFRDAAWGRELKYFCLMETVLVFLMLSALYKSLIFFDRPQLAEWAYHALWVWAVFNKIFWFKIRKFASIVYAFLMNEENYPFFYKFCNFLFPLILVVLIYMPDPEAVVARIFIGEQFHHYDVFIMAPAWGHVSGNILGLDQIADYGVGMPVMISGLSQLFGGFSYLNTFLVLMWGCIIYYVLWFALLRKWMKSFLVAALAILVGIRVQMFHTGIFPFIFGLPSATVFRYPFDVLFFFCLLFSFRKCGAQFNPFLILAGMIAGVAVFYMISTGMALIAALYFYLIFYFLYWYFQRHLLGESPATQQLSEKTESLREMIFRAVVYFSTAPLTAFLLYWLYYGHYLWKKELWENINEFTKLFLSGTGYLPFLGSFKQHDYLANLIGVLLVLVHVLTILSAVGLFYCKKIQAQHLFAAVLSVYGLAINQYYVSMSAITTYYTTGLPFIFVLGYWLNLLLSYIQREYRRKILMILILVSIYALATNHNYLAYPNLLNVSRNPLIDRLVAQRLPDGVPYFNHLWSQYLETVKLPKNSLGETFEDLRIEESFSSQEDLKAYFRRAFDFTEDALLIQKLTSVRERAALISSFDVKILMQANRRPFFYYFPMVISRPMRLRMFGVTSMYTTEAFKKTIRQLETEAPEYIFLERIYLSPKSEVPRFFNYQTPALLALIDYVKEHYEFYSDGKYLVAMKRKTGDPVIKGIRD